MQENNSADLRVIRTKESIRDALVALIEEKGFEAITVKDITTRAKINRGTFYAHYQDKFDLMTKCEEEIMHEMTRIANQNFPGLIEVLESDTPTLAPNPIAIATLEYINQNSEFMKAMLGPKGNLTFQSRLKEFLWKTIFSDGPNSFIREENLLVPGQYLASYIASAHIGVIQKWLESGRQESPLEMANILSTMTIKGLAYAAGLKK
ncbi:TetR/AcrR family transcriptional regulator [Lysinibacillus sp. SGAir0095]|uniref:TetR/AcrR family transcriptional regulator n=1 Tax=Lysinibacillus sp. SGAir0095 TaxID=2070463 RepID=UPI0010CD60C2|nr:TetR/AcrR family transcriptional regulator [Lysinibacillus sp. SGAir0095]QCR31939.1 TetR family transcriptional regulator [Lysinibacillus sp. SGAir0095]